jgi:molybdenum cofactor synthesis domain-containing protein
MALVSLEVVREHVLARCHALGAVEVPVTEALGTVLAAAVEAPEAAPPFANSAMDGFAVRGADVATVPVTLRVIATIAAGADPSDIRVGEGEAARIMTGAALPTGADAVVMIEETDGGIGQTVEIRRQVEPGDFVRGVGDDVHAGDTIARAGDRLTAARVGLLAAVGCQSVRVIRRPRVGVLSTGDELVPAGAPLRLGQIRDSNRTLLLGLIAGAGCVPVDLGVVGDDHAVIAAAVKAAANQCDALLTSGGVSVGDFDFLAPVLAEQGEMAVFRMAIKPAKPFVFGVVGSMPVFALPGNPVSAAVSFELLARPGLRKLAGDPDHRLQRPAVAAVADEPLARRPDGKTHYVRVAAAWGADGRVHVRSAGGQGSHVLSGLAAADGLAVLPDGDGPSAGDDVAVLLFGLPQ